MPRPEERMPRPPCVRPTGPAAAGARPAERRRIESQALFDGRVEIEIEHFEQVYRLRQTSLGKLILTK
jgi:hemin uptake protein HemP